MTTRSLTHVIPISNGILAPAHCERIGVAIWPYLWMVDHITKEIPGEDGQMEGLVYGGRPIRVSEIATDLGLKTRTIHAQIAHLVGPYLRKIPFGEGVPSGYVVLKSKKWTASRTPQDSAHPSKKTVGSNPAENCTPSQDSAGGSQKNCTPPQKNCRPPQNSALLKGNSTQQPQQPLTKSNTPAVFDLPTSVPRDAWEPFMEMRRKKRVPNTERAMQLLLAKLERFAASGQDPGEVLDQSTRNGWTDVYELKTTNGTGNGRSGHGNNSGGARFKRNIDSLKQAIVASGDYAPGRDASSDGSVISEPGTESGNLW